jgi:glycosyltransferase involved in cell wall biosynthesis
MLKLSIITVNLNNRDGLLKTVESVFNQTCTGFEYLIIDGGSTDGSREIIETHSSKLSFWVSEPDRGIYHAMNKGIEKAKGEYVLFLNSGDFLVDGSVLEKVFQIDFSEEIVVGDCHISQNGKVIFHATPPDEISLVAFYGRSIPHQSTFFLRDLFDRTGQYTENFKIHSDLEFFIKSLIIKNCSYRHIPVTVSNYNMEGISGSDFGKSLSENERNEIITNLVPSRILVDYATWTNERKEMSVLYWVKSKPFIYKPFKIIFHLSKWFVTQRRNK